eukprot:CAMPEP_0175269774 /NCGR_PEP_ID=MMETSP0093-20121207/45034_1 /TAXON_ID=311494 /ORGANISM="Alexandrium monilatum, Strain CCMP3105" /LENGTH=482 /DNA_ID=CAMNT_0016564445 /DNA_START=60 /DNA_END=1508 /DNA_ORIENTATION=+
MAVSASDPIGTLYYLESTVYKAQKALVAAKFNGIAIKEAKFDPAKDLKKPDFIAKNPTGKVPFLETDMGVVFTSNAIARFVARCRADTPIYGKCFDDEGQIDTWLEFCTHEVEVPLMTWVYPVLGLMEDIPEATKAAQDDIKGVLAAMEKQLASTKYLIGDFLTLADIALVCALREGFARVFEASFRKPFPKVCAWFEGCCAMPQFKAVLGEVKLCTKAEGPKPVPKDEKKAKEAKPKAEPKAEPKAKAKAEAKPAAKAEPKAKAAPQAAAAPAAGNAETEAQIKAVGDEIRTLKEKLKAEGLSGKKINEHAEIKTLVGKLNALKEQANAAPAAPAAAPVAAAAAPAPAAGGSDVEGQIKAVGDEIRALKEKLKADGLSNKQINDNEQIKTLVAQLQDLKSKLPADGAAASAPAVAPAPAAAAPAAAPAGGNLEAQIKAVGDEIRELKAKLKAGGLSGKKVDQDENVKKLVAQLQELKKQQG